MADDSLLEPDDPPGAHDEDERLLQDGERDGAPGISGPEHLGLTPPG